MARPGVLTTQEPFYFEGAYAEKIEDKYILHDGVITDCHSRTRGGHCTARSSTSFPTTAPSTHNGIFHLKRYPVFFFPYFYKGLKKEPRKSGFLTPEAGHSSQFGYFFGAGYYWAINRSFDMTYLSHRLHGARLRSTTRFARASPTQKTDFNLIFYGVQDRGMEPERRRLESARGQRVGLAKIEFGDGVDRRAEISIT